MSEITTLFGDEEEPSVEIARVIWAQSNKSDIKSGAKNCREVNRRS